MFLRKPHSARTFVHFGGPRTPKARESRAEMGAKMPMWLMLSVLPSTRGISSWTYETRLEACERPGLEVQTQRARREEVQGTADAGAPGRREGRGAQGVVGSRCGPFPARRPRKRRDRDQPAGGRDSLRARTGDGPDRSGRSGARQRVDCPARQRRLLGSPLVRRGLGPAASASSRE